MATKTSHGINLYYDVIGVIPRGGGGGLLLQIMFWGHLKILTIFIGFNQGPYRVLGFNKICIILVFTKSLHKMGCAVNYRYFWVVHQSVYFWEIQSYSGVEPMYTKKSRVPPPPPPFPPHTHTAPPPGCHSYSKTSSN